MLLCGFGARAVEMHPISAVSHKITSEGLVFVLAHIDGINGYMIKTVLITWIPSFASDTKGINFDGLLLLLTDFAHSQSRCFAA
jgi:hypothetical protein